MIVCRLRLKIDGFCKYQITIITPIYLHLVQMYNLIVFIDDHIYRWIVKR